MNALTFQKASKRQARLRMALIGPSGSGKTMTALKIGSNLGQRVALLDTERGSASKYADLFDFFVLELETFNPESYIAAIEAAGAEGFDVFIIDSLSHAWTGKDGALELVDQATKRSQSGNSFAAWREVTPLHNKLVDAIVSAPMHVIVTMRTRTEYVVEKDERTGKSTPRKIGLQPVQRQGLEYEFDVVADLDLQNNLIVSKTRCPALNDQLFAKPGPEVAAILKTWLSDGEPVASQEQYGQLLEAVVALAELDPAKDWNQIAEQAARRDYKHGTAELTQSEVTELTANLVAHAAKIREEQAAASAAAANGDAPAAAEEPVQPQLEATA